MTASAGAPRRAAAAFAVPVIAVAAWALVTQTPATAMAQCAVCGNPAFSAGDNDLARTFASGTNPGTRVSAGLVYATQSYQDLYSGTRLLDSEEKTTWVQTPEWALRVHLMTLLAGVEFASGTELAMVLPTGVAQSTRVATDGVGDHNDLWGQPIATSSDRGLSDLELRLRQRLAGLLALPSWFPQVVVAAGAVAPTGSFIVKDPNSATTDQYVSLGRGSFWALGDLDVFGRIGERFGWVLSLGSRLPMSDNVNGGYLFRWGPEVRTTVGANAVVVPELLHAALSMEWQWRGRGKERFSASVPIEDFPNGGGDWLTLQPTLQAQVGAGLSVTATARIPIYRKVHGFQPVPGFGAIAALNWAWSSAAAPASAGEVAAPAAPKRPLAMPAVGERATDAMLVGLMVPGKVVLVDWWAEWCAVCKKLAPELDAFVAARPDVQLHKVDVTDWEADRLAPYLSDAPALPVLDVYDRDGRLLRRLHGPDALNFAAHVPPPPPPPVAHADAAAPTVDARR